MDNLIFAMWAPTNLPRVPRLSRALRYYIRLSSLPWNQCPDCLGITVQFALEFALSPKNPTLIALLQAGATIDEFQWAADEAKSRGKCQFSYLLGIVKKKREEVSSVRHYQGPLPANAKGRGVSQRQTAVANYATQAAAARARLDDAASLEIDITSVINHVA